MNKWLKMLVEMVKTFLAYKSVDGKETNPGTMVTEFLGDALVDSGKLQGALGGLVASLGGAAVNEAIDFVKVHKDTIFSMSKKEFKFLFGKIFKDKGAFTDEDYKLYIKSLDDEMLVAEAEANADAMAGLAQTVRDKKALALDLKHKLSVFARFALAKAISIASHGVL